jgi:hypothetical protein
MIAGLTLVCTFLKVSMEIGSYFVSARTNKRHHHLDVIGGVESALREGCLRTMTGVSQCWLLGHFRQVCFSNTNALPRINIGDDVWGESSIMTGVY